jgi:iron(III) transport system substrate-binding protein
MAYRWMLALLLPLGLALPAAAQECCPKDLVDAAAKEGKIVLYTANLLDTEQIVAREFNKKYPQVKVDIVRAPGARLFTRVETEAASNQLGADILDMTDRGLAMKIESLFIDYAPPNAAQYDTSKAMSKKLWPRSVSVNALAYNPALVKDIAPSWQSINDPAFKKKVGIVIAGSGGTTWTTTMFQRKELGLDFWKAGAAVEPRLYESNGPLATGLVRGEVSVASLLVNASLPLQAEGAPIKIVYPKEGLPITPGMAGIFKTAKNPNAAKLYLNWALSLEGQNVMTSKLGYVSLLKGASPPPGAPADAKLWLPDNEEYEKLRDGWIAEWNTIYGYQK